MLTWAIENTLVAGVLALIAGALCYLLRSRPALCHLVWVLVLVRLVVPPLPAPGWPPEQLRDHVENAAVAIGLSEQNALVPPPSVAVPSISSIEIWRGKTSSPAWSERTASWGRSGIHDEFAMAEREPPKPPAPPAPRAQGSPAEEQYSVVHRQSRADGTVVMVYPPEAGPAPSAPTPTPTREVDREVRTVRTALVTGPNQLSAVEVSPNSDRSAGRSDLAAIAAAPLPDDQGRAAAAPATAGGHFGARLGDLALLAWVAGSLVVLALQARRIARINRLIQRAAPAGDELAEVVGEIAGRIGVRPPRIRVHPHIGSPAIWCLGRPVLLWPVALLEPQQIESSRGVIAHELAHLRRRDHWVAWLEVLAITLLWWNPLLWLVRSRIRFYSELSCDAWVLWALPGQKRRYAEALIETVARLSLGRTAFPALGAVDSDRRTFEQRVRLIMSGSMVCRVHPSIAAAVVAVAVIAVPSWSFAGGPWTDAGMVDPSLDGAVSAQHERRKAGWYFRTRSWADAAESYARVLEHEPESALAAQRLAESLTALNRHDEALAVLDGLSRTDATGEAHVLAAAAAEASGDTEGAMQRLRRALERGFDDHERVRDSTELAALADEEGEAVLDAMADRRDLAARAVKAMNRGEWKSAAKLFRQAAEASPLDGAVQQRLGFTLLRLGDLDEAVAAFERQLELGHRPDYAHYNTACAHALAGRTGPALESLEAAVNAGFDSTSLMQRDPDLESVRGELAFFELRSEVESPRALHGRIIAALEMRRFDHALRACKELLKLDTLDDQQRGWIHHRIGLAHFGLGDTDRAAGAFAEQVRLGFWVEEGLYRLACCHAVDGRGRTAIAYLERAVDAGLADGSSLDWLDDEPTLAGIVEEPAYARIKQRAYDQSILENSFKAADWRHLKALREADIAENPYNGPAHLQLTWSYLRLSQYDRALEIAKKQERMGYMAGVASYNVACAYAMKKELDLAMQWLERARDEHGFWRPEHTRRDLDLANLRQDPRFERFLSKS